MMWSDLSRNWAAHVPQVLTRWPELDEDEVLAADGDRDRLATHMADTFGYSTEDADLSITDWIKGQETVDAVMDETRDNARITASARDINPGEDPSDDDRAFGDDTVAETPMGRT